MNILEAAEGLRGRMELEVSTGGLSCHGSAPERGVSAVYQMAPAVGRWTFCTNGVATVGLFGMPSIGFGPGHEHFAHFPDECGEIEHLLRATAFYAAFAEGCAREHAAVAPA